MHKKMIEEKDTIYELDEECINRQKEERENKCYDKGELRKETGDKK